MRKIILSIALSCAALVSLPALDFGAGLTLTPSLAYGNAWSPAIAGGGLAVDARFSLPAVLGVSARVGLEAGIEGLGAQVVAPLRLEWALVRGDSLSVGASVGVLPGLALFRPSPLWLIGGEMGAFAAWYWADSWGVEADLGLRYLTCPEYSARVAPYAVVNLPITVALRYRLR